MHEYRHHVSGFFPTRAEAHRALSALIERGLPRGRLRILDSQSVPPADADHPASDEVLKDVLVGSAVGATVGTGLGALSGIALAVANVSLFVASPLIAPLALLGWGASLGGFLGAATGAGSETRSFSDLVSDAIANGQIVLLAETLTEYETSVAREIIEAAVGGYEDASLS